MEYDLIVFSSVTTANRVKNVLSDKHNIQSKLMQTPAKLGFSSCSYCLKFEDKYADIMWKVVCESSLSTKGIFSYDDFKKIK